MGCTSTQRILATQEEAYVLYMQEKLGIHKIAVPFAIETLKKYSNSGTLSTNAFALALHDMGLLKLKDGKVDKEDLRTNRKEWTKFYGCLSDYRDDSGETFNTLNVVMTFILLSSGTEQEKVKALYENLDWQCRGYIPKNMIRLFIKNFCVVSGEILPYYAEDTYLSTVNLKEMRTLFGYGIERAPDYLTKRIVRDWPRLNKEEFISTLEEESYRFLFNAVLLRRWLVKTYKEEFEKQSKLSPKRLRLSVFRSEGDPSPPETAGKKTNVEDLHEDIQDEEK